MKIDVAPRYLTSAPIGSTVYDSDGDIWEAWSVSTVVPEGVYARTPSGVLLTRPEDPCDPARAIAWVCDPKQETCVVATMWGAEIMGGAYGPFSKEVTPYGFD